MKKVLLTISTSLLLSQSIFAETKFQCPSADSLKIGPIFGVAGEHFHGGEMKGRLPNTLSSGKRIDPLKFVVQKFHQIRLYNNGDNTYYMDCHYTLKSPEVNGFTEFYIQHVGQKMAKSERCSVKGKTDSHIVVEQCSSPEECVVTCD